MHTHDTQLQKRVASDSPDTVNRGREICPRMRHRTYTTIRSKTRDCNSPTEGEDRPPYTTRLQSKARHTLGKERAKESETGEDASLHTRGSGSTVAAGGRSGGVGGAGVEGISGAASVGPSTRGSDGPGVHVGSMTGVAGGQPENTHRTPVPVLAVPVRVEERLAEACLMVNCSDCARMVFVFSASLTRLTWKPVPAFHPPLGGLTVIFPRLLGTRALRTCDVGGYPL